MYNKVMETKIEQTVAETKSVIDNIQIESDVNNVKIESAIANKQGINSNKKPLTPYQKYKNIRNQNGKKYFEFYNDVKVYTHNIYDW